MRVRSLELWRIWSQSAKRGHAGVLGVGALAGRRALQDGDPEQRGGERDRQRQQRAEQPPDGHGVYVPCARWQPSSSRCRYSARLSQPPPTIDHAFAVQRLDGRGERVGAALLHDLRGELDLGQRQPCEIGERRAAGAEVGHAEAEAVHPQAGEQRDAARRRVAGRRGSRSSRGRGRGPAGRRSPARRRASAAGRRRRRALRAGCRRAPPARPGGRHRGP